MKRHLRVCSAAFFLAAALILSLWLPGTTATVKAAAAGAPAVPRATGSATANTVTLKWNKVSGATGYSLYLYNRSDQKFHWFKTLGSQTTTLKLTGSYRNIYYYKLRSYKLVKGTKVFSDFCNIKVKTAPSMKPGIISATRDRKDSGVIKWQRDSFSDGYEVYRAASSKGGYTRVARINSNSTTSFRDTKLSANSSYYYRVRSFSKNGSTLAYGYFGGGKTLPKYAAGGTAAPAVGAAAKRNLLVVGDSRVLYMSNWYPNSRIRYIAKSGQGIAWLSSASVQSQILAALDGKTDLCLWIGTNDYDYLSRYASYYQTMVPYWKNKGARVYFMGLGPFMGGSDGYGGTDNDLIRFNNGIITVARSFTSGVSYLDFYSYLKRNGVSFLSGDRVHYSAATTKLVYDYLVKMIG